MAVSEDKSLCGLDVNEKSENIYDQRAKAEGTNFLSVFAFSMYLTREKVCLCVFVCMCVCVCLRVCVRVPVCVYARGFWYMLVGLNKIIIVRERSIFWRNGFIVLT